MTIDEAIVHAREVASRNFDDRVHCIRCAEEHEQLAGWLEELKAYRAIGTKDKCRTAVDKVVEQLDELRKECKDPLHDYDPNYFIDKAIEIVKGSGVNGNTIA